MVQLRSGARDVVVTSRLCAAIAGCLAAVAVGAPCRDPGPIEATPLDKADPAVTTWTRATKFGPQQAVVKLPTPEERAARVAALSSRNPGFSISLDETGRLQSVSSSDLPCRVIEARLKDGFTFYARSQDIDPWFDELAWALEIRNWDALGHERAPTKAQRSSARVTFERARTDGGVEVRFMLTFWSDPRPIPRAGKLLSPSAMRALVKNCQLEAVRVHCAPCRPPGPCRCARDVRAQRPCGANLTFNVVDHYVEQDGVRRYLRIATPGVDDKGLPRHEDAPWNIVSRPLPLLDAVTGADVTKLWETEFLPVPVDEQPEPIHGMVP